MKLFSCCIFLIRNMRVKCDLGIKKWLVINEFRGKRPRNKHNIKCMYVILWETIRSREILRYTQKFALSVFVIERLDCIPHCIVLHPRFLISFCFSRVARSDWPRVRLVGRGVLVVWYANYTSHFGDCLFLNLTYN